MKKSLFSLLSVLAAVGTLSPTIAIPTSHAEIAIQESFEMNGYEIDDAIDELLESVQRMRQTVRLNSRVPGANKRLSGQLENLENNIVHVRNMTDRRTSNRELSREVREIKESLYATGIEFGLSTLALIPSVQKDWYAVVMDIGALNHAVNGSMTRGPRRPDPRTPDPRDPTPGRRPRVDHLAYEFRGTAESSPMYFYGSSSAELLAHCKTFLASARLPSIWKMADETGATIYNGGGSLSADEICGVAALNATIKGYEQFGYTTIGLESTRVRLNNALGEDQIKDLMDSVSLPRNSVWNVTVRGKKYSIGSSRSISQQKAIVKYNTDASWATYTKVGAMEGIPFRFSAFNPGELQTQCLDFYAQAVGSMSVWTVSVDGKNYSQGGSYNATSACMTVMAAQ